MFYYIPEVSDPQNSLSSQLSAHIVHESFQDLGTDGTQREPNQAQLLNLFFIIIFA